VAGMIIHAWMPGACGMRSHGSCAHSRVLCQTSHACMHLHVHGRQHASHVLDNTHVHVAAPNAVPLVSRHAHPNARSHAQGEAILEFDLRNPASLAAGPQVLQLF